MYCITVDEKNRINKLIRKAGSVIVLNPDSLEVIVEKITRAKLKIILSQRSSTTHCIFFFPKT